MGTVTGYRIGNDGVPVAIPGGHVTLDGPAITSAMTPDGSRLFVAVGGAPGHISSYAVAPSGALAPSGDPNVTVPGLSALTVAVVDPDGRFLRVTSYADGNLSSYAIGPDHRLTPMGAVATGMMPVNPSYTPDGRFLYVSHEGSTELRGYAIGRDGALTPTPGSPYPAGIMTHGAKITADGHYLYVPEAVSGDVRGYRIGPGGALTPLPGSPYTLPLGTMAGSVVLGPDHRHLYESDVLTTHVTSLIRTFDIQPDGSLTRSALPDADSGTAFSDGPVPQLTH
jgi:6-phosphogluconolactonase (cycloisomerase 2 family)